MRKALVTLTKRVILDKETDNEILKEVLTNSYSEIEVLYRRSQIADYSLNVHGDNLQLKAAIDTAATRGSYHAIFKLNGAIPDLWDATKYINLKSPLIEGQMPNTRVEVIEFVKGEKDKLRLAVYFETESLVLLDSIADKLLLAFPLTEEADSNSQVPFIDTFFLKLTDDIYFSDYKVL